MSVTRAPSRRSERITYSVVLWVEGSCHFTQSWFSIVVARLHVSYNHTICCLMPAASISPIYLSICSFPLRSIVPWFHPFIPLQILTLSSIYRISLSFLFYPFPFHSVPYLLKIKCIINMNCNPCIHSLIFVRYISIMRIFYAYVKFVLWYVTVNPRNFKTV